MVSKIRRESFCAVGNSFYDNKDDVRAAALCRANEFLMRKSDARVVNVVEEWSDYLHLKIVVYYEERV